VSRTPCGRAGVWFQKRKSAEGLWADKGRGAEEVRRDGVWGGGGLDHQLGGGGLSEEKWGGEVMRKRSGTDVHTRGGGKKWSREGGASEMLLPAGGGKGRPIGKLRITREQIEVGKREKD